MTSCFANPLPGILTSYCPHCIQLLELHEKPQNQQTWTQKQGMHQACWENAYCGSQSWQPSIHVMLYPWSGIHHAGLTVCAVQTPQLREQIVILRWTKYWCMIERQSRNGILEVDSSQFWGHVGVHGRTISSRLTWDCRARCCGSPMLQPSSEAWVLVNPWQEHQAAQQEVTRNCDMTASHTTLWDHELSLCLSIGSVKVSDAIISN